MSDVQKEIAELEGGMKMPNIPTFGKEVTTPAKPVAPAAPAVTPVRAATADKKDKITGLDVLTKISGAAVAQSAVIPLDSDKQRLMLLMSKQAHVCGFIVPTGPKQTLSVAKVENQSQFRISIVERMSKKVVGTIIKYSPKLRDAIKSASVAAPTESREFEDPEKAIELPYTTGVDYVCEVFGQDAAIKFMTKFCHFFISEAPAIYVPHKRKKTGQGATGYTMFNTPADEPEVPNYRLGDKIDYYYEKYLAADADKKDNFRKKLNDITLIRPLLSSYRGTTLASTGNYIALSEYAVIKPSDVALSAEEAQKMNEAYVAPLFKNPKKLDKDGDKVEVLQNLIPEQKNLITQKNPADKSEGYTSELFSVTGASKLPALLDAKTSIHAFGMRDAIAADEIALVERTVEATSMTKDDGSVVNGVKIKDVRIPFGKAGNTLDLNGKHKRIMEASGNALTPEQITSFIEEISKNESGSVKQTQIDKFSKTANYEMSKALQALTGLSANAL